MTIQKSIFNNIFPSTTTGKIMLSVLVLVAFSLGSFFTGSDNSSTSTNQNNTETPEATIWTCSMHPQIHLPKPGKCPICFMDLIPLESSADGVMSENQIKLTDYAKEISRIQSSKVTKGYATRVVRMTGKISFDETRIAYITARFPGRLDKLYADYTGMFVNKGDHLASIYSPQLLSAQEELIQAVSTIEKLKNSESKVLIRTAQETLNAAREKLRLYELTDEQIKKIEVSRINSDHLTIYSPIEGIVVHKNAKEGMYVKTGNKIYTLADLSKLWVYFDAYESDLVWLRVGQKIIFTTTSFASKPFSAIISFIDPIIDQKTRTIKIRAVLNNNDNLLKPDMLVHGEVSSKINANGQVINDELAGKWISPMHPEIVKDKPGKCDVCGIDLVSARELGYSASNKDTDEQPLLVPATSLLITGTQAVVFIEKETDNGSLYEARQIKIGPKAGEFYIVYEGLSEGETIVTNGAFKIDAELQIQAKPSMMSPDGGAPPPVHDHGQMKMDEKNKVDHSKMDMSKEVVADENNIAQLTPIYDAYFELQMALANDDLKLAQKSFTSIAQAVDKINKNEFTQSASQQWDTLSKKLNKFLHLGKSAHNLVTARDLFFNISKTIIQLEKTFGHSENKDYYLTFCPMARNNDGAFWLQEDKAVYNSFYGNKMLKCGEIKETFSSTSGSN